MSSKGASMDSPEISAGLVAGIVIIAVVLVATLITLLIVVCLKMRNRQQQDIEARSISTTNPPTRADRLQFPNSDVPNAIGPSVPSPPHPGPVFGMTTNASSDHANVNPSYDYASPRSPINKDSSWSKDPHYMIPRPTRFNINNDEKEDPHYVTPRSPNINRCDLGEEDANYANLPIQTNAQKKESDYDNPPIPRSVQDIGGSPSKSSEDHSQYDTVGKPRPVKASHNTSESKNTSWKSTRKFKSPFFSVKENKTSDETEPIYANT